MKIIMRFKAVAQRGRLQEVIDMIKEMVAKNPDPNRKVQIYSPYIGDNSVVTWDIEIADHKHLPPFMEQLMMQRFADSLDNNIWMEAVAHVETEVWRVVE